MIGGQSLADVGIRFGHFGQLARVMFDVASDREFLIGSQEFQVGDRGSEHHILLGDGRGVLT